ncbi:hypothetical protein Cgig2_010753 [Carnegiea gigantea]|uniref:Phospholipid-transporting ATPase n=1 Tax=Carnegiea gigantea TaxID=171969 RepID=A0A9Q1QMC9_9CARY|nr:hypothetical protein Cgig2_010753 [Carnegiea gigantea]
MGHGKRRKLHFSKIYTFHCGKASFPEEDHSQIGGPGFSRVVVCNEPNSLDTSIHNYPDNYVRTTKYTLATFFPKSLFEQFRRVANFFFLVTGIVSFTPLAPYTAVSAIVPLFFVIGVSMLKEAIEDWRRKQQVCDHSPLIACSSFEFDYDFGVNLALEVTSSLIDDSNFKDFKATLKCEDPNANLYAFVGTMEYEEQQHPLSPQQLLLRDSKLRNTDYVYGAVIFTGHDTKVMQNSMDPPSKRSRVERKMDQIIYFLFCTLFLMAFVGSVVFGVTTKEDLKDGIMKRWYLKPDDSKVYFDPRRAPLAAFLHFLTALMLYSYLIPISLYVSIEIVKILQSHFINQDINMYYEEADKPAHARTSNLNEELGQVDTVLSDKTGTLTCNSMEFMKCSVAGTAYGRGITEVERAMAKRKGSPFPNGMVIGEDRSEEYYGDQANSGVKGFNFKDERIMNGNWVNEPHSDVIQKFFQLLALCHTVIPEVDEETGKVSYEAESPDEAAFVIAAREIGFEFYKRTQTTVSLHELDPLSGRKIDRPTLYSEQQLPVCREYKILTILEFNSTRKRMSVIVQTVEGKIVLLSKGADRFACSLLRQGMKQIVINSDTSEIKALEKVGDKDAITKASRECVLQQIKQARAQFVASAASSYAYALIIDGKSLVYALEDEIKYKFLELAIGCASVICCRSSPKQKALVTRLVKDGTRRTTLAIGDGANDVGMLQEADIGIGISGAEGMQAVMSSDIAIAQFRFLERLLLVHGHWCYRRITSMICYFFYKNVVFGVTVFLFEGYASFSGQPAYDDWFLSLYNVLFTSLPAIALGVFDQDVSARYCLKVPPSATVILNYCISLLCLIWQHHFGQISFT